MELAKLDEWCEKAILGLVLGILVYAPLATGAVRLQDFLVVYALTIGVVAFWTVRIWIRKGYRWLLPPVTWVVLGFLVYAVVRYRQADIEYVARLELLQILVYTVLFFAILDNLNRQESIQLMAFVLIFLAMTIAFYALYQYLTGSEKVWHFVRPASYKGRGSGTFICPNHLAGFLEMILPLGLAYTLTGRVSATTRVFVGYAALMAAAGIGVSLSRGGWIATVLSCSLFFILLIRKRDFRISAIALLLVLIVGVYLFATKTQNSTQRFQKLFSTRYGETSRYDLWHSAIAVWHENFWWGVGPAHFDHRFRQARSTNFAMRPVYAHNDYLNTLADWGLVGAILAGSAFLVTFWGAARSWKYLQRTNEIATKASNKSSFVLGALIGLAAMLIHSFTDFNMHVPSNALVAVALLALLAGHWRHATERFWVNPQWYGKLLLTLACLGAMAFLASQLAGLAAEQYCLIQARRAKPRSDEYLRWLKEAYASQPRNAETTATLPLAEGMGGTAYHIGETLRLRSWEGRDGYEKLGEEAIVWFQRGAAANKWEPYCPLRTGMTLDWLGRKQEALPYYIRAVETDPHNYFVLYHMGWHYFQARDYATAKIWLDRSMKLRWDETAAYYLSLVEQKLSEQP